MSIKLDLIDALDRHFGIGAMRPAQVANLLRANVSDVYRVFWEHHPVTDEQIEDWLRLQDLTVSLVVHQRPKKVSRITGHQFETLWRACGSPETKEEFEHATYNR